MLLHNMHYSKLDIWVVRKEEATGFQLLTARAKIWAMGYKEVDDPKELDSMLWIHPAAAGQVIMDLSKTTLNVLLDDVIEGEFDA